MSFIAVLLVSFMWHFPASWVVSQPWVSQNLPANIKLQQTTGLWWQGTTNLQWQNTATGQLTWQWQPLAVLKGKIAIKFSWQEKQQFLNGSMKLNATDLELMDVSASIKLPFLAQLSPNLAILSNAKGEVLVNDFQLTTKLNKLWPETLAGKISLVDADIMGIKLDVITLKPEILNQQIILPISGGGKDWKLAGQLTLDPNNRFKHQINLIAETPQAMPDWTAMFMQKTSPTQAELVVSGSW